MNLQEEHVDLPPPPDQPRDTQRAGCRLWIGNLDNRVTEFSLMKLLQKYGELSKFDFLYHKTGPDQGKPRGYCFVTYASREDAERTKRCLNGKLALSKKLVVKDANTSYQDIHDVRTRVMQPAEPAKPSDTRSKNAQIRAIETKLRLMKQDPTPVIAGNTGVKAGNTRFSTGHSVSHTQGRDMQSQGQGPSQSRSYSRGHRNDRPYGREAHR